MAQPELLRVEATDVRTIVLDLSQLTCMDSAGVGVLVRADARSRTDSNRLVLRRPPIAVRRVLSISGFEDVCRSETEMSRPRSSRRVTAPTTRCCLSASCSRGPAARQGSRPLSDYDDDALDRLLQAMKADELDVRRARRRWRGSAG